MSHPLLRLHVANARHSLCGPSGVNPCPLPRVDHHLLEPSCGILPLVTNPESIQAHMDKPECVCTGLSSHPAKGMHNDTAILATNDHPIIQTSPTLGLQSRVCEAQCPRAHPAAFSLSASCSPCLVRLRIDALPLSRFITASFLGGPTLMNGLLSVNSLRMSQFQKNLGF